MKKCNDCGKMFNEVTDHLAFIQYVKSCDPEDDQFVTYDTEPYGVPLCLDCALNTYDSIALDMDLDVD